MEQDLSPLIALLRIPSISTKPEFAGQVRDCAEMVAGMLRQVGLENIELLDSPGRHPLVYGDWLHAPGAPTLLLYGHYDVQPPEPLDEWKSPPFEPTIRGEHIYARGAADDKGLVLILIHAVERLLAAQQLGVNIKFLIEGEEESGGEHLTEYVRSHPPRLQGIDAAIICDTEMFAPELPTICVGLRGIIYGEIHVEGARQDLHSGVYGGAAPNALHALAQVLSAIKGPDERIDIPGFYDAVKPPTPEERTAWARLPFDEEQYRENEMTATALIGEDGIPLFERLWCRPTFEVHGIQGGFTGEGAKTVIPAKAMAKVSFRLVPDQSPEEMVTLITKAVADAAPRGTGAEFRPLHAAPPSVVDPANPYVQAAAKAMTAVFGAETVFTRSGGSIPVVALLNQELGLPSVMMGFGLPDDNLHAPNERLYLPNFHRGIVAVVQYLESLKSLKNN
jgi:acetylornithine deacetylase/succinyl-diaminopimelate desuccinylase-like protein